MSSTKLLSKEIERRLVDIRSTEGEGEELKTVLVATLLSGYLMMNWKRKIITATENK